MLTRSLKAVALTVGLSILGCSDGEDQKLKASGPPAAPQATHSHPTEGPHHGSLIELGAEEYHGELVHDEKAGSTTIYILDSAATQSVPIEAGELTINLKHDGKAQQFKLTASPDAQDPTGKSSRFVSTSAELGHGLDDEHADAALVVMINGKSFRGKISHSHGHDHGHKH